MKEIHVRRHAHKNHDGDLSGEGIRAAIEFASRMPRFHKVVASDSKRTQVTARLLTGIDPLVDVRAGYSDMSSDKVNAIEQLAIEQGLTFFEAAHKYQDVSIITGLDANALRLSKLIDDLLDELEDEQRALIVSHEITIVPAMIRKGVTLHAVNPLEGYVLRSNGSIKPLK